MWAHRAGPHFLQIPGPSNFPGRILRAIERPTMDHRGPEFHALAKEVLAKVKPIFKTEHPVVIFPSSGTGAWEAALVNTLSPGDSVLMYRSEEHTSELQSLMRNSYAVFCLKKPHNHTQ